METDALDELEPARVLTVTDSAVELEFDLPMPSISRLELSPA